MLFKTSGDPSAGDKHSHFVYIPKVVSDAPDQPLPVPLYTANDGDHAHEVVFDSQIGAFTVVPAGNPAHTHELAPFIGADQKGEEEEDDETEVVSEVREKFQSASDREYESRKAGKESYEFYRGDQWAETDRNLLREDKRACITVNECAAKIDMLLGYQRQNRTDVRFFPTEEGDKAVGEILTVLLKNIYTRNNMQMSEYLVAKDQVIAGRGVFHSYIDYTRDIRGEIKVESLDWRDVYLGPHDKPDLSDCEWLIKSKWFNKDKLEKMYPDKKDDIEMMFDSYESRQGTPSVENNPGERYSKDQRLGLNSNDVDMQKKNIRVYECWEKEYFDVYGVAQYDDDYVDELPKLKKSEITQLEQLGLTVAKKVKTKMCVYTVAGNIMLDQRTEDIELFPVVIAYAKKDDKGFYGKVEEVKDVQREINKRHSQAVDVVNKLSSYGWFFDNETFDDPREENAFKSTSATSGFCVKVRNLSKIPSQSQGVKMPTELVGMQQLASEKLALIMNITPETMGFNQREVSSVALMESRKNAMTAQEFLFDNMAIAKKQLSLLIVKYMQKIYTAERVLRIIRSESASTENEDIAAKQMEDEAVLRLLNETDLTQYDVSVETSPYAPSIRSANFALLLELVARGAPIPPEIIIEASDLPNKERILGTLSAQAQAAAQAEQGKQQTEITKTQISAQAKMAGKSAGPAA